MTTVEDAAQGREAFGRQAWAAAYASFAAADRAEPLALDDVERLAVAAYLTGRDDESLAAWNRAHEESARSGQISRAVRSAFWLAFSLLNRGDLAQGGGSVDRAQRLLEDSRLECVEQGYLRYEAALRAVFDGDVAAAHAGFAQAAKIAVHYANAELTTLARVGEGRCLIFLGETDDGVALLDEAMVSVTAREMSPIAVGDAYCTMIEACQELFDVRRAQEWTAALSHWCDSQPELVLNRGRCLVHRAEIMQLRGEWADALEEARRACERVADPSGGLVRGTAIYLQAELHRLRGELAHAEDAYRRAHEMGRDPQPGLAQLRAAQGRQDVALASIRRVLDEAEDPVTRARVLGPFVEITLASGDVEAARTGAAELAEIAATLKAPFLQALSAQVTGAVMLAEGDTRGALGAFRRAWAGWRDIGAHYEAARTRVELGRACRALGDEEGAEMELDAARSVFERLGAALDLARVEALSRSSTRRAAGGLTARELEVLELVARGMTNRAIASELIISEKTVATHVGNIFTKLGLSSRSAATAYAYEHNLL